MSTKRRCAPAPGRGFALLVGTGVLWGTIGVAAKLLYQETDLDAISVTWLRAVIATPICVGLAWRAMGHALLRSSRRDLAIMVLLGLMLILYQWLYLAAVDRLGVSAATLVSLCVPPVLVAIASAAFLGERPTSRLVLALVGALVGTALLVARSPDATSGSTATLPGLLLALGSACGITVHVLASRLIAARQHPLRPLAIGFPVGVVAFLPVVAGRDLSLDLPAVGWLLLAYLGIVPSALAYWMYQRGLRDVTATTASIVTLLEPLTATALATAFLGERLAPGALAGGLLVLAAVAGLYLRRMGDSNSRGVAPNPLSKRAP